MTAYDFLQQLYDDGCCPCPFMKSGKCDCGDGYTMMDEHGICPVEDIQSEEDLGTAKYPLF